MCLLSSCDPLVVVADGNLFRCYSLPDLVPPPKELIVDTL